MAVKQDIHPNYPVVKVTCTCGNTFETKSTYRKSHELKLEVCGECHPFYTGKQKIVDSARRIDRFYNKYGAQAS